MGGVLLDLRFVSFLALQNLSRKEVVTESCYLAATIAKIFGKPPKSEASL